ncbi:hypothetical protein PARPLA_00578 [Rhodobacteraceae bacterium THAF1]|nr:hypothetical protein FIU81_14370 [Palleronia sp. THAF1]VDC17238.1 hypothetical protein PARPLA_00578 [Rhodobacteraceae bacterium THAF1]
MKPLNTVSLFVVSTILTGCVNTAEVSRNSLDGSYSGNGDNASLSMFVQGQNANLILKGRGCLGEIQGRVDELSNGNWTVSTAEFGQSCKVTMKQDGPLSYIVDQGPGCSSFHGAACGFSGYVRKTGS